MTSTATLTHTFTAAGCVNQWHADHDDAKCIDELFAQGREVGTIFEAGR